MTEFSELELIGIVIATIAGLVGIGVGINQYLKTHKNKSSELHLQLKMAVNNIRSTLDKLNDLLPHANSSRASVFEATGYSRSSEMKIWDKEFEVDAKKLEKLVADTSIITGDFRALNHKEVKSKLVEVLKFQKQADFLKDKYKETIKQDEKSREQIDAYNRPWIFRR